MWKITAFMGGNWLEEPHCSAGVAMRRAERLSSGPGRIVIVSWDSEVQYEFKEGRLVYNRARPSAATPAHD